MAKSYVLTADVWYRPGNGDDGEPRRIAKGAVLDDLTDAEVRRLSRQAAIAEAKSDAGKLAAESPAPDPDAVTLTPQPTPFQQSEYGTALANSGLGPDDASGGQLNDEQWEETFALTDVQAEAIAAAQAAGGADARIGAGEAASRERPLQKANVDEWRRWAVTSGKVTADQAEGMNKPELQALAK